MNSAAELRELDTAEPLFVPSYPALTAVDDAQPVENESANATARRVLNVTCALVLLLVTAPLMLLAAIAIRLDSPGPIIYRQTRVGIDRRRGPAGPDAARRRVDYGGRLFTMYKFRTMRATREPGPQIWARPDDERITRVGAVLRKFRIDELPQLVNVLKGDMNLIGPRPEQPEIVVRLRDRVEGYARRQRVLPGITGWAQVNNGYDQGLEDVVRKVELDLEYIRRASVVQDLDILFRTVPVVLFRRGAI